MQTNEIAREVGVSEKTVKRRVKLLTDNGILRFGISHNPQKISGYIPFTILLHTNTDNFNIVKKIQNTADSYFFVEPYINGKTVVLHLYCSNIYITNGIF
jgi:DNA-binding Lrp family transcriptional regulator